MFEWTWTVILRFPGTARFLGQGLIGAALVLTLIGWRGHKMLRLLDRKLERVNLAGPESLSAMYPTLPTWWIPETTLGFTLVALLLILGVSMTWAAKTAQRWTR